MMLFEIAMTHYYVKPETPPETPETTSTLRSISNFSSQVFKNIWESRLPEKPPTPTKGTLEGCKTGADKIDKPPVLDEEGEISGAEGLLCENLGSKNDLASNGSGSSKGTGSSELHDLRYRSNGLKKVILGQVGQKYFWKKNS